MSFRGTPSSPSSVPRRPPPTSFTTTTGPAGVFRDDGGYSDDGGESSRRPRYSDHVVNDEFHDDDDDDMDDEIIIDTTDQVSRIRTSMSTSQRSLNQQQGGGSSSQLSVGSGVGVDPPGSVYGDHMSTASSVYEYDDSSEADPVIASTKKSRKKSRKGGGGSSLGGGGGDFVTADGLSPEKSSKRSCCYRWLCGWGKFGCIVLFVLLLAIAVTTAGVVMSRRGNSSNNSKSQGAGASPSPSPTVDDPCPLELSFMQKCFGNADKEAACENCVVQYWPTKVDNCDDIDDETCSAFRECPCAPCVDSVDAYVHCLSGCQVECPAFGGGTLAPTVTPAPTPPLLCPDQYQAFDSCVDPTNGGSDCENCVASNWPPPPAKLSCQEIADYTCPVLAQSDNCGCNHCDTQLLDVLLCLSNCTSLSCGNKGTGTGTRALGRAVRGTSTLAAPHGELHWFAEYFEP